MRRMRYISSSIFCWLDVEVIDVGNEQLDRMLRKAFYFFTFQIDVVAIMFVFVC